MGETAFYVLALALSGVFGALGVLLGLRSGVRSVERDEGRFEAVASEVERVRADQSRLRIDWGATLENLEQLAAAIEKGRRRIAASESRQKQEAPEQPRFEELSPAQQRDLIRQRLRRIA